jgi:hypothetical protein
LPARTSGDVFGGFGHDRSQSVESLDTPPTPPLYSGHSVHSQRRGYAQDSDQESFTLVSVDICAFSLIFTDNFGTRMEGSPFQSRVHKDSDVLMDATHKDLVAVRNPAYLYLWTQCQEHKARADTAE